MAASSAALARASREIDPRDLYVSEPGTSRERGGGNIRGDDPRIVPFKKPRVASIDSYTLCQEFNAAVRADVGAYKNPTGRIAEAADCNIRTGENYLLGKNLPNALQFLRIAASPEFPHVRALVLDLIGLEEARVAEAAQKFNEFVAVWLRAQGAQDGAAE